MNRPALALFATLLVSLFSVLDFASAQPAATHRGSICLISGDTHSPAAVAAAHDLLASLDFAGIGITVIPDFGSSPADLRRIAAADAVVIYARGRDRVVSMADVLQGVVARGGSIFMVGPSLNEDVGDIPVLRDKEIAAYFAAGGRANLVRMIRAVAARKILPGLAVEPAVPVPDFGFYDSRNGLIVTGYDEYRRAYVAADPRRAAQPWVGVIIPRSYIEAGATGTVEAVTTALESRGLNVLAGFCASQNEPLQALFLNPDGTPRVEALASLSLKMGFTPQMVGPALTAIGAPVINGLALGSQSHEEWAASPTGVPVSERWWQLSGPELAGSIAPTVLAAKERVEDTATGSAYVVHVPIAERIEQYAERVARWVRLRHAPAADRRVAVIYYNYTPGKASVGASYLNVLPQSLGQILGRLRADGYKLDGAPASDADLFTQIQSFGTNARPGEPADLDRIVRGGDAVLWPVAEYRKFFDHLPEALRQSMIAKWGEPEASRTMVWHDRNGRPHFVFPTHRWGNVVFAPQPVRGWGEDPTASYHDLQLPVHHQYLAFYLWLQTRFDADAIVHVGRHATHEWMPGKEVGFTPSDPGEVLAGAVPQLYIYIVDGIGEGLQAKRRGMATIISHLTPPLDRASLSPELRELKGRINDYNVAREKGSIAGDDTLREIAERAAGLGLLLDLGISPAATSPALTHDQLDEIENHIANIGDKITPFGLHTFGVSPDEKARRATATAILDSETTLTAEERTKRLADLMNRLAASGPAELDALSAGLAGRYIAASPGNDPIRQPESLPTGRNFYGFDPTRLPTKASYETGRRLATGLLENYRAKHGVAPDRLTFNLWSGETNRHEGVMEAQIFALLGVRPVWNRMGRVESVELIPRQELGRPRVDVTIAPSGLYRDAFPVLMHLLDDAVTLAKQSPEADNAIARNVATVRTALAARGVPDEEAERLATVRIFTVPVGAYGAGIERVVTDDKGWNNESQVADVFFNRMGHLFGQGFWGEAPAAATKDPKIAQDVFKLALKGSKAVIHSRSGAVYATVDIDDFYQYLGGTAMAIRQVDGSTPDVLVTDMSNPRVAETVTLERFMGQEMRARYFNPKWIEEMLDEGYAGARFIMRMTDNLWGWQVTVPEAVGDARWQEMFEVYVQDRYNLDIRGKFEAAGNLHAYQAMVDRMLVAVDKGYWQAADEVVKELRDASATAARQIAVAEARELAALPPAPAFAPAPPAVSAPPPAAPASVAPPPAAAPAASANAGAQAPTEVTGKAIEEAQRPKPSANAPARWPLVLFAGLAAVALLFGFGWWRQGRAGRDAPAS